jgi:hypothetical protein
MFWQQQREEHTPWSSNCGPSSRSRSAEMRAKTFCAVSPKGSTISWRNCHSRKRCAAGGRHCFSTYQRKRNICGHRWIGHRRCYSRADMRPCTVLPRMQCHAEQHDQAAVLKVGYCIAGKLPGTPQRWPARWRRWPGRRQRWHAPGWSSAASGPCCQSRPAPPATAPKEQSSRRS